MPLSSSQIENILDRVSTKTGVELSSVSFSLFHSGTLYPTLLYGQNIVALRLNFEIRDYFRQRVSKNRRSFKVFFSFCSVVIFQENILVPSILKNWNFEHVFACGATTSSGVTKWTVHFNSAHWKSPGMAFHEFFDSSGGLSIVVKSMLGGI